MACLCGCRDRKWVELSSFFYPNSVFNSPTVNHLILGCTDVLRIYRSLTLPTLYWEDWIQSQLIFQGSQHSNMDDKRCKRPAITKHETFISWESSTFKFDLQFISLLHWHNCGFERIHEIQQKYCRWDVKMCLAVRVISENILAALWSDVRLGAKLLPLYKQSSIHCSVWHPAPVFHMYCERARLLFIFL